MHSVLKTDGRVIAYSTPSDGSQVRDQAALVSMLWSQHSVSESQHWRHNRNVHAAKAEVKPLQALLIEYGAYNIVAQRVDEELILVLISGKIPGRMDQDLVVNAEKDGDVSNGVENSGEGERMTPLGLQRQKAQTLAKYIAKQTKSMDGREDD